jgi:hypothetical protein
MGVVRPGGAVGRRRVQRHLSHRCAVAGQYLCSDSRSVYLFVEDDEQLDKYLEVADRLPRVRRVIVVRHGRAAILRRPTVISLERCARSAREYLKRTAADPGAAQRRTRARPSSRCWSTPRAPPAAQGRDDQPQPCAVLSALSASLFEGCRGRRAHRLPAAVPYRRAADREYVPIWSAPRSSTTSRTPRPCSRTCARCSRMCSSRCRGCGRRSTRR